MDNPIVSVIIPVYKVEQFLEECLNSVIRQEFPALEVILVDDGSPDSCPEICDRYAEAYDYIKAIHQNNKGLGPARNTGLEASTGKYIMFVDSDDCLDGYGAIQRMVERAEETQADIVVGSFRRLNGRQLSGINHHRLHAGTYEETADFRLKGFVLYNHLAFACAKLYRHAFLTNNDLKFKYRFLVEDKSFNMMCYACKPMYAYIDESVYLYRVNGDSITSRYHDTYASLWITVAYDFERFLSERGVAEAYDDLIAFHLCFGSIFLAMQEFKYKGLRETVKALSIYGKDPLVRKMVKALARGKYIDQIELKTWKLLIWGISLLCSMHAYALLALGIWLSLKMKVTERFVSSKYEL